MAEHFYNLALIQRMGREAFVTRDEKIEGELKEAALNFCNMLVPEGDITHVATRREVGSFIFRAN